MSKTTKPTKKQSYLNEIRVYNDDNQHVSNSKLIHMGESNSKVSDIKVLYANKSYIFIEVKMEHSRATGQFVVVLDIDNQVVLYSTNSECKLTKAMENILQTLNDMIKNKSIEFKALLNKKIDLEIPADPKDIMTFVKERYKSIGVGAMSAQYQGKDIKFVIDKLEKYATAKVYFRYHASGSNTSFAGNDFVQYFVDNNASYDVFRDKYDHLNKKYSSDGSKYVYVKTDAVFPKKRKMLYYKHNDEKYLFRIISDMVGVWKVSKCSKTNNPCIEARIEFIRPQDPDDLDEYYQLLNGEIAPGNDVVVKCETDATVVTLT